MNKHYPIVYCIKCPIVQAQSHF